MMESSILRRKKAITCRRTSKNHLCGFIVAFILTLWTVIGYSLHRYKALSFMNGSFSFLAIFFSMWLVLTFLCNYLYKMVDNRKNGNSCFFIVSEKKWVILFVIVYGIYYIWLFPGIVSFDCVTMIEHMWRLSTGGISNTANPPFQTMLFCLPIWIADIFGKEQLGIAIYTLGQLIISVFAYIISIRTLREFGVRERVVNIVATWWLIWPIYGMYANSINKDSIFSSFMLIYCVLLLYAVFRQNIFFSSGRMRVSMFLVIIFVSLLRNGSIYIVLLTAFMALMAVDKTNRKRWMQIQVPAIILCGIFLAVAQYGFGERPKDYERMSVMFQQTARYTCYYSDEQTDEEIDGINCVLDYSMIKERYIAGYAEPMMILANHEMTNSDKKSYLKIWKEEFCKHPICYITATLANSYEYYYPVKSQWNTFTYNSADSYERLDGAFNFGFRERRDILALQSFFNEMPVLFLTMTCGFYSIFFVLAVGKLLRTYKFLVVLMPELICYIACLFLPANGNFRYMLSICYIVPFLLGLCWMKANEGNYKHSDRKRRE